MVIKPKGYQVFPSEIEDFIEKTLKDKVAMASAVGAQHDIFTEAVVLFVEKKPGASLTVDDIMKASDGMAAYKRPSHVVILEQGKIPLNRVAKTDYLLKRMAKEEVKKLHVRQMGQYNPNCAGRSC